MKKYRFLLLFVIVTISLLAASCCFAEDPGLVSFSEDVTWMANYGAVQKAANWLTSFGSGYACKVSEHDVNRVFCKQLFDPNATDFSCGFTWLNENGTVNEINGGCETDNSRSSAAIVEHAKFLDDAITDAYENFVYPYALPVTEEEWENAVDKLYKLYGKRTSFSYTLFGEQVLVTSYNTAKDAKYILTDMVRVQSLLDTNDSENPGVRHGDYFSFLNEEKNH